MKATSRDQDERRKRILVVDDDECVLCVFRGALLGLGSEYEIITASSGRTALAAARDRAFDLVITDLGMPDMDGIQVTEALRACAPGTVVVWITAYGCRGAAFHARRLGVDICVEKPVEVEAIRRLALVALGRTDVEATADSDHAGR
jgi:CheY-like chemotaxis protein